MLTEKSLLVRLRLRLTGVYLAAVLGFIALAGGLSFGLLRYYFQTTTDSALRNRMALEFIQLGVPLPPELQSSRLEWLRLHNLLPSEDDRRDERGDEHEDEDEHEHDSNKPGNAPASPAPVDGEISGAFVVWLDGQGRSLLLPAGMPSGFAPSLEAVQAAEQTGLDWRTVHTPSGEPVRLLTYAVRNAQQGALYLQAGRSLLEQEVVASQFVSSLAAGGGALAVLAALLSWVIAGRSLKPTELAWERQREFVANASHELRAPLSLIQLSAEMAARPDTPPAEQRELVGDVLRETRHMARLVSDLLLLSRADAGRLPMQIEPVPVQRVLDSLASEWRRLCASRGIHFEAPSTSAVARMDEGYLRQALLAVLDNAARYTPAGGRITIRVSERSSRVDIAVSDTGPGIPPQHLLRVFDRFYQADPTRTDKAHAGLGLSIVRTLIEAMGGTVRLDSPPGLGLTVTLSLPKAS
jgi:signal transduction histidine kinase